LKSHGLTSQTGAKTEFNARQGHSRSSILGSLKSRRRTAYCYIITLASSLKYPKKIASENAENCRSRQPHCRLTPHSQGTYANIRINFIPPETRHWSTFLSLTVWICVHSNFCARLRKTHLFYNRVRIGRSRSSKVDDFGINRKGVCHLLLVINSNFGPILHHF